MAPLTWTLRDLTTPNWGISMQASKIWIISTGIPSLSRPRTKTYRNKPASRFVKFCKTVQSKINTFEWMKNINKEAVPTTQEKPYRYYYETALTMQ